MPITTVIFDYGCVLSLPPATKDFEPLYKPIGVEPAGFEAAYWRHRDAYDIDAIDASGYWGEFGREVGCNLTPAQILEFAALDCEIWGRPNLVMVEWVRLLRGRGLNAAIISNVSRTVGDYLRQTFRGLALFNPICFSGELKIMKPDPGIFHNCLAALGEPAAQTLFIDDRQVNIAAARASGMNGIVFHSGEQLQAELEPYGLAESLAEAQTRAG